MEEEIELEKINSKNRVRLGIIYVFMKLISHDIRHLLVSQESEIKIELTESNYIDLSNKFNDFQLDILICLRMKYEDDVISENLIESEYVALFDQSHPLAVKDKLLYTDLDDQVIVLPSGMNLSKVVLEEKLEEEKVKPKNIIYMSDPNSIMESIVGTQAICIQPKIFSENLLGVELVCKNFQSPLPWYMDIVMHKKDSNNSAIASSFRDLANAIETNGMF